MEGSDKVQGTEAAEPAEACERCGAPPVPAGAVATAPARPDDADQAVTHCEWCGAEYPMPEAP